MKIELIRSIIEVVENTPVSEFDMNTWGTGGLKCGFVGCAVGNAVRAGVLPGLSLRRKLPEPDGLIRYELRGHNDYGFFALSDELGCSVETAEYMFSASEYRTTGGATKENVLSRLKEEVALWEK